MINNDFPRINGSQQWDNVTPRDPCPICAGRGWCSVQREGNFVLCRRVFQGCTKVKTDKNGAEFYLHRTAGGAIPHLGLPRQLPSKPTPTKADPATLHRVYSALLARLTLSQAHRDNLRGRGLDHESIDRGWYRSLPDRGRCRLVRELHERFGDLLLTVPGFVLRDVGRGPYLTLAGWPGLLVPCRDLADQVVALKVRLDAVKAGEKRYRGISSGPDGGPSCGAPVHAPRGTPLKAQLVRITEGELKSDIAWHLDPEKVPTLSAPGASNWMPVLPVIGAMEARTVRIAFDRDAREKVEVANCLKKLAVALAASGRAVELEVW